MSLHLTVSDSLHTLAQKLHERFAETHLPVFQPRLLVTQTVGMNNWLKIQIATYNKEQIAANLFFLSPADVLHKVYAALGGSFPEKLSSSHVCWIIYSVLGEQVFQERYPLIAQYYLQDQEKEQKQMALAEKIADLLDQYQVYRPHMMADWNLRSFNTLTDSKDWQIYIWLRAREMGGERFLDRTQQGRDIHAFLEDPNRVESLQARIPELHLFGLSILTQYHIDILQRLSTHIDIHFYLLNPAPETYWYSDISEKVAEKLKQRKGAQESDFILGNPLLMQWGTVVKDSFALMFAHDDFLNAYETIVQQQPTQTTLLSHIQLEIHQNIPASARSPINLALLADESLTIQSHYTPAREVEALYNYLVHLIDQKKDSISARDIVVMVTNIDEYAPFIQSVFDHAPYSFPYTIADESIASSDNIVRALSDLLSMDESTFTAERVLQLLEHPSIRTKFNLHHFDHLRSWVDRVNIRFGFYGDPELDTQYVSWKHGIRRLMLGICMGHPSPIAYPAGTIDPFIEIEGSASWEAIRFCQAIEVLIALIEQRKEDRNIEGWIVYTRQVIQQMISLEDEATDDFYQSLEDHLDQYIPVSDVVSQSFSYQVFTQHFLQTLQSSTKSKAFAGSGITFCSPVPMRSIPFKVVAFLGLNFDQFPRKEVISSFDLMQQHKQRGDRNVKQNDKHLFLETLLSAQHYLFLSYIGRDSKDNSILPPSALVDELIDYIEYKLETPVKLRTAWVVQQPLHAYSRQYNQKDARIYSYTIPDSNQKDLALWIDEPMAKDPIHTLPLSTLETFFSQPAKYYVEQVLGIYLRTESNLLPETELFSLDHLSRWQWRKSLLELPSENWPELVDEGIRTGALPLRNLGRQASAELESSIQSVEAWLAVTTKMESKTVPISIRLHEIILEGSLESVYEDKLIQICFSKNESPYQIKAYIRHIIGIAAGQIKETLYYSVVKAKAYQYPVISQTAAMEIVRTWVDYWHTHAQASPALYPPVDKWNEAIQDPASYFETIEKHLEGSAQTYQDQYAQLIFEKGNLADENTFDDFVHRHKLILQPSQDVLES
jgi:exodeoxyribonuclease V gamma subunit